jgi:hypothetical protein
MEKNKVQQWLDGPRDFQEGLKILREVSKKYQLMEKLRKRSLKPSNSLAYKHNHEKLVHELEKVLKPDYLKFNNKNSRFEDQFNHVDLSEKVSESVPEASSDI